VSEIADLSARRWQKANTSNEVQPMDALEQAIREIKAGETTASHVIVCVGNVTDSGVQTVWFQAGELNLFGQLGLIERVKADLLAGVIS